jgi:hypothetical protein
MMDNRLILCLISLLIIIYLYSIFYEYNRFFNTDKTDNKINISDQSKNINTIKKLIIFRPIDMGIKLNGCTYTVTDKIDINKNLKMFNGLINLFKKLQFDDRVILAILYLKLAYNKPILYGVKNSSTSTNINLEFYIYNIDHNLSYNNNMYNDKYDLFMNLYHVLTKLYYIPNFTKSTVLLDFIKQNDILIISFNIETNGNFNNKINIYTDEYLNDQKVNLTFEFDIINNTIKYSNTGIAFKTKDEIKKLNIIENINKYPDGSKYIIHNKDNNTTTGLYIIEPKKNKVKHFLSKYNYDKNIKNYIMSNIDTKSIDLAYNIKDDKVVRTAFYDVF